MRLLLPLLWLTGCGSPITNASLYADAEFLAALPATTRHGPPLLVLDGPGTEGLVGHSRVAARDLEWVMEPAVLAGDALRTSEPRVRETLVREWSSTPVVTAAGGTMELFWVRGEMIRPEVGGEITWSLEVAAGSDGPWVAAASGAHEPDGSGSFSWDHAVTQEITDRSLPYVLHVDYETESDEAAGERLAEITLEAEIGTVRAWTAAGQQALGWTGLFALTDDGETWPGSARVVEAEEGGHGSALLQRGEEELTIESCWGPDGTVMWRAGDGVTSLGDETACTAQ